MVEAVDTLTTEKSVKLFEKFGIFTKAELESRKEVLYETYAKSINIEALTMVDMANKQYIPAVVKYTKSLADTVIAVKDAGADTSVQAELLNLVSAKLAEAKKAVQRLEAVIVEAAALESSAREQAFFFHETVMEAMAALRAPIDALETVVDKEVWPVPSYGDLIFEV